jgi:hypothetical protein
VKKTLIKRAMSFYKNKEEEGEEDVLLRKKKQKI